MNLRNILFDNWGIKLISFFFAITLWLYVTSKGKTEMTVTVPLQLRNVPHGMTVVGDVAGFVDVRVQGQERLLRDITSGKKLAGMLDLSMARAGENTIRISPDAITRPVGVAVTYISPSVLKVKLEPLVMKTFRLHPLLHGVPAVGYRVAKIVVTPPRISIEGPASAIAELETLQTMPIDIQGAKMDVAMEPKIDYQGQPVKLLEQNISVRISIERKHK